MICLENAHKNAIGSSLPCSHQVIKKIYVMHDMQLIISGLMCNMEMEIDTHAIKHAKYNITI